MKAGLDEQTTKKLLARSQDQDIKDKLKANSQEAFELGAFGAPFIVVYKEEKPEVFFGSDRFNIIAHILGKLQYYTTCVHFTDHFCRCEVGRTTG